MADLLQGAKLRVSSVLNGDTRQYGKQFLTDGRIDTCWNSAPGLPQFIEVKFAQPAVPTQLCFRFQGGFAGKTCRLLAWPATEQATDDAAALAPAADPIEVGLVYPEDINDLQHFAVDTKGKAIAALRILFEESTDFFGRVTLYTLELKS